MRHWCGWGLALLLGGCTGAALPPPEPPPKAQAEPPYRRLIAEHLDTLFAESAGIHAVSISGLRQVTAGLNRDWMVCLRGTAKLAVGNDGANTYAIFINQRNEIVDRRLAEPEDGCDRERYTPLARTSR